MMQRAMILAGLLLAVVGTSFGGDGELTAVRSEAAELRAELGAWAFESPQASQMAAQAREALSDALDLIDEADEDRVGRAFGRLSRAVRIMGRAARKEKSEEFDDFVDSWGMQLWLTSSLIFVPSSPIVGDSDEGPLEKRLRKKVLRAALRGADGNYAGALSRFKSAWRIYRKIQRLPN